MESPESIGSVCAVLALGSNLEPKAARVLSAISWLQEIGEVESCTRPYETPPLGGGKKSYCNAVVKLNFNGTLEELEKLTKSYEIKMGRDEESRTRGDVPIDLDIVISNGTVLRPRDYNASFFLKGWHQLYEITY